MITCGRQYGRLAPTRGRRAALRSCCGTHVETHLVSQIVAYGSYLVVSLRVHAPEREYTREAVRTPPKGSRLEASQI